MRTKGIPIQGDNMVTCSMLLSYAFADMTAKAPNINNPIITRIERESSILYFKFVLFPLFEENFLIEIYNR